MGERKFCHLLPTEQHRCHLQVSPRGGTTETEKPPSSAGAQEALNTAPSTALLKSLVMGHAPGLEESLEALTWSWTKSALVGTEGI